MPISRPYLGAAALAALLTLAADPAAAGAENYNCVRSGSSFSCNEFWGVPGGFPRIVRVPGPRTEIEEAEARERERRWVERCRPVIRRDRYGVGRYFYVAAGCEFGRYQD